MNKDKSLALYEQLFAHMNEAVWVGDENEITILANPKFCELMEMSVDEMLGRPSYDFWDETSAARVRDVNETKRKKGVASHYEGNLKSKSGKLIPVLLHGAPLPGGGTVGIMTDLRDLYSQAMMHKRLVEHMNEAVWMGDKNEITIYANPKFCELMEMPIEEMLGCPSYDFWDEESANRVRNVNDNKRKQGVASSYEGNLKSKSGKLIPVLLSGTPLSDAGTIGIMTDMTQYKEKEKAEKTLNKAIELATDSIVIFDNQGVVQTWNKGARQIFGYKKDEMMGQDLGKIFEAKNLLSYFNHDQQHEVHNLKIDGKHKNNRTLKLSATVTPIIDEDQNKIAYCLLIGRDVTNQAKAEHELSIRYERIQEAYTQMGLQRRHLDYIVDLLKKAKQGESKADIAQFISRAMLMVANVDASVLRLYNSERDGFELASHIGAVDGWKGKSFIPFENSLAEKAFTQKAPLRILDISNEPKYQSAQLAKNNDLFSLMLIPLIVGNQKIGTISLYAAPEKTLEIFENSFIEEYGDLAALTLSL